MSYIFCFVDDEDWPQRQTAGMTELESKLRKALIISLERLLSKLRKVLIISHERLLSLSSELSSCDIPLPVLGDVLNHSHGEPQAASPEIVPGHNAYKAKGIERHLKERLWIIQRCWGHPAEYSGRGNRYHWHDSLLLDDGVRWMKKGNHADNSTEESRKSERKFSRGERKAKTERKASGKRQHMNMQRCREDYDVTVVYGASSHRDTVCNMNIVDPDGASPDASCLKATNSSKVSKKVGILKAKECFPVNEFTVEGNIIQGCKKSKASMRKTAEGRKPVEDARENADDGLQKEVAGIQLELKDSLSHSSPDKNWKSSKEGIRVEIALLTRTGKGSEDEMEMSSSDSIFIILPRSLRVSLSQSSFELYWCLPVRHKAKRKARQPGRHRGHPGRRNDPRLPVLNDAECSIRRRRVSPRKIRTAADSNDASVVSLHPRTRSDYLSNLQLLVSSGNSVSTTDNRISAFEQKGAASQEILQAEDKENMHHLYTHAAREVTSLQAEMRRFFTDKGVHEEALQESDCMAVKELDKMISSVTSEWRSPFGQHLRDIIASPAGQVQLYQAAGLTRFLCVRFHSFTSFPACDQASPIRLAQAGFFYTGQEDTVQCFQCEKQHRKWTVMDIPLLIHYFLSPNCPVVMRKETASSDGGEQDLMSSMDPETGVSKLLYLQNWRKKLTESNVAANSLMAAIRSQSRAGGSRMVGQRLPELLPVAGIPAFPPLQAPVGSAPQTSALPAFGAMSQTGVPPGVPVTVGGGLGQDRGDSVAAQGAAGGAGQFSRPHAYKNFALYEQRINSYRNWPEERQQRPEVLARAGFFYAGSGDCVRCYHCGLGLKHWDDDDDPWLEHVRWRSTCEHLINTQGQDYLAQAFQEIVRRDRDQEEIVQRFALDEEPRNVPRPPVSNNYQDINNASRGQPTQPASLPPGRASQPSSSQTPPSQTPPSQPPPSQPPPSQTPAAAVPVEKEKPQGASNDPGKQGESALSSKEGGAAAAAGGGEEPIEGGMEVLSASERDRLSELKKQNQALRQQNLCRKCGKEEVCMLFLPCQHLAMCEACAKQIKKCPMCHKQIKKKVKTFLS